MAILLITLAAAVPNFLTALQSYRMGGDAQAIASQIALARVGAAAEFDQAQVNFNLAGGSYQRQLWDKATNAFDINDAAAQTLSTGVTFSLGGVAFPAGSQTVIQQ